MEKREYASSIDIKKLADSLRGKFETLYPLSQECCIYRVPEPKRCLNPSAYAPQTLSIGPLHHAKEELEAMEEHKIRYLHHFLQRTKVSLEEFLAFIKEKEAKLRSCYAETIKLESDDFVRMILVDAVFLIEYFLRSCKLNLITDDDRIFRKPSLNMRDDLWIMENQLPMFILNDLFNLAKTAMYGDHYEGLSLIKITRRFQRDILQFFPIKEKLLEINFSEAEHFLDLLRLCLQPSQRSAARTEFKDQNIPSATELHQAGVKFMKPRSSKTLLDITFTYKKGILEIPYLTVYDNTERFYRNLLIFENMHGFTRYFSDYVVMMSYLICKPRDAELLIQNGIIGLGESEMLSTLFQNLVKDSVLIPTKFQYSGLVEDLNAYCRSPWHMWKAILKQNYFNTPWASISVIAAVILLVLTFIQTTCSIIALP